jgi:hypothetical protein
MGNSKPLSFRADELPLIDQPLTFRLRRRDSEVGRPPPLADNAEVELNLKIKPHGH